jgi:acyl-CoA synthetase (AMP-forming)/AMP-acid ligase II
MNIVDAFLFQARHQPMAPAVCAPGTRYNVVSYARLELFASNIAWRARSSGLQRGDTVAVFSNDPIFHLALVLGLTRIGLVTLSARSSILPNEFPIAAVVTDSAGTFLHAARVIRADESWIIGEGKFLALGGESHRHDGTAPARIVLTSGTTGDQKAVSLSHDDIVRRLQAYDIAFGNQVPASSRMFLDIGLTTSFGFAWTMYMLARGGTVFFRGSDPAETMQAFGLYDVQCMVASPAGTAEFLDYYERTPAFICPFRVMLASGSLLSQSLSERVRARMCSLLMATYGASEVSPVAVAAAHRIAHIGGAVGYLAPWLDVQAVDDADRLLAPGAEGLIRIRGDTCVAGYLGNPPGSEQIFRGGWFYPGDIGTVTEDRLLIISGREKAVINVGGDKISPEAIEAVLLSYPGVIHAAAFGRANDLGVDEPWAVVVTHSDIDPEKVRGHCARRLPRDFVPVRVLRMADIPRNDMGRVDRAQLARLVAPN